VNRAIIAGAAIALIAAGAGAAYALLGKSHGQVVEVIRSSTACVSPETALEINNKEALGESFWDQVDKLGNDKAALLTRDCPEANAGEIVVILHERKDMGLSCVTTIKNYAEQKNKAPCAYMPTTRLKRS
jgi:hypothetical protein